MIVWTVICLSVVQDTEFQKRWSEVEEGHHLAWAEHITGQDTDTHTTWHDFKSIAVIHGRSAKANGDIREDDELWAVVDRGDLGIFIEQFQALDWGDDSDYCWFVDAGTGDGSDGVVEVPEVPAVPPAAIKDEAYAIVNTSYVSYLDSDFNFLANRALGGAFGMAIDCSATAVTEGEDYFYVVAYLRGLTIFDSDHVRDDTFFDDGNVTPYKSVRITSDKAYTYAASSDYIHKYNNTTGANEWSTYEDGVNGAAIYVDDADEYIYVWTTGGLFNPNAVVKVDSDGNVIERITVVGRWDGDIEIDESATPNRLYGSQTIGRYALWAINADGTDEDDFSLSDPFGTTNLYIHNILLHNNYIYTTSKRVTFEGDTGSMWKFDDQLNVIDFYDTGYSMCDLWIDWDGNIAATTDTATGSRPVFTFDEDLNLIAQHDNADASSAKYGGSESVRLPYKDEGTAAIPGTPGVTPDSGLNHLIGADVCVYADGIPLGVFTVTEDANGTGTLDLGADYDVVIAGINYYSIYESFPLIPQGEYSSIKDVKIDFYESMGCHVGVTLDDSVDWTFSYDNFATAIDPVTEIKEAPFVWGIQREPTIYLHEWDPVPMSIRGIYPLLNLSIE